MAPLRGDSGLFRGALLLAGFFGRSDTPIFNDNHHGKTTQGTRRLKLWGADAVLNAPLKQRQVLEQYLREAFGDRILAMYFVPGQRCWEPDCSLCIQLRD